MRPSSAAGNRPIEKRARFDVVRYANCWEDADILLKALEVRRDGFYLSVSSAGDNTLSILSRNPAQVIAVDLSTAQLACLDLKRVAFSNLDHEGLLRFLGIHESADRLSAYRLLRGSLSASARSFWDRHPGFIERGIIHTGKFEGYFRIFRRWVLPIVHGRKDVAELRRPKDARERRDFYRHRWDTARWRLLFRLFFSKTVMGHLGRDPEFFRYAGDDLAGSLLKRASHALTALPVHDNPYLEYILTGNFRRSFPHYLRSENFDSIRKGLDRLVLFKGNVMDALNANKGLKFNGFNLSDIFEYMSYGEYSSGLSRFIDASKKGGRLVYWNMLADRSPPSGYLDRLDPLETRARELFMQDRAFFYRAFRIEVVR